MKVIFEYEDGTYRIVPFVNLKNIEERIWQNYSIDEYLFDDGGVVNKYIIANDNRLAGFEQHKDIRNLLLSIKHLRKSIELNERALEFYRNYEDLTTQIETKKEEA